jgi:uncharacterized membrane protein
MVAIVLAALSALAWGTADFAGGKASQRTSALTVSVLSKLLSLPVLGLYLVLLDATVRPASLGWGAAAGVAGMAGLVLFYRALAGGAMAVVAPVSAVTTALVPLVVGLAIQDPPGPVPLAGAACALVAIALVSLVPGGAVVRRGLVGPALAAGTGFGLFFVFLQQASAAAGGHAGLWPVLSSQLSALVLGAVLLVRLRTVPRVWGVTLGMVVLAGLLDMTANALYLLAVQGHLLSIVAPIASLYPVSTVLLALAVDKERLRLVQVAGLGFAATALVLVAS